jgi:hypothetical protein
MATNEFSNPAVQVIFDQIDQIDIQVFDKLQNLTNLDIHSLPWYTKITATKGGAAGKGPEPPEPPIMSTEGSAQYPNLTDELEAGESEGKTKMAFAKMQVPSNIREAYILVDADFIIEKEVVEEEIVANPSPQTESFANENVEQVAIDTDSFMDSDEKRDSNKLGTRKSLSKGGLRLSDENSVGAVSKGSDASEDRKNQKLEKNRKSSVSHESTSPQTSPDSSNRRARKTIKGGSKTTGNSIAMSEQASKLGLYS